MQIQKYITKGHKRIEGWYSHDALELMAELKRGDRVITIGGIYGVLESVSEESVVIKVESGTTMRMSRKSVAGKRER